MKTANNTARRAAYLAAADESALQRRVAAVAGLNPLDALMATWDAGEADRAADAAEVSAARVAAGLSV